MWLAGQIGMKPQEIARVMTEAVVEFAAKSPRHLHQITVCIFQPPMMQEFADAVAKKASSGSWKQTVKGCYFCCIFITTPDNVFQCTTQL